MTKMLRKVAVTLVVGLGATVAGCATATEWETWKSHPVHFASGNHAMFSMRNGDTAVRVSRADLESSRDESWFGKALTVDQSQIVER